jgi:peptidoglycan hydrolase-like protein with peptidoglycan-binding domain
MFRYLVAAAVIVLGVQQASAADDVAQAQLLLRILGYDPGPVDGSYGGKTGEALTAFYAARGGAYDGTLDGAEISDIYASLAEVPFNGVSPQVSAADGQTSYTASYDFVPAVDLAVGYEPLRELPEQPAPFESVPAPVRNQFCDYNPLDGFPAPSGVRTYRSMREFEAAKRTPHPDNRWVEDLSFAAQRAGAAIAATGDAEAVADFKAALLTHAAAGSAVYSARLVDRDGKVVVVPDLATLSMGTTSVSMNYVASRERLGLSPGEADAIESWLDRLYENYIDSYFVLAGPGSTLDPRGVDLVARGMMVNALIDGDVEQFNNGAKLALTVLSFVREDGSDRFGASRGNRALFYQGVALMSAMENLIILNAAGSSSAVDQMQPTIHRLADFYVRAVSDSTLIEPYAREDNATYPGANYRRQETRDPSEGLDPYSFIAADQPVLGALMALRATYPYERQFGQTFNETCWGLTLPGAKVPERPMPEGVGKLEITAATVTRVERRDDGATYTLSLGRPQINGEVDRALYSFEIMTDWDGSAANVTLFRLAFEGGRLRDAETREADYSACEDIAWNTEYGLQLRLHIGFEERANDCIFERLGPNDRLTFLSLLFAMDQVIAKLDESPDNAELRALYAQLP